MEKIVNCILYSRVSGAKQSKYGESLEHQEQECRRFAKSQKYQVLGSFKEQYTGTTDKRPELEKAYDFIVNSELPISYLIIHKIDRNTRGGIIVHEEIKKRFKKIGVTIQDTQGVMREAKNALEIDGINTEKYTWSVTNEGQYAENISVMMAEDERHKILQRLIGQSIRNNKRGYKVRNSDFGYKNAKVTTDVGKKTIQVEDPKESVYIKRMFELRARGDMSDLEITKEINTMGYLSRTRYKWNKEKTKIIGTLGGQPLSPEQLQRYIKNPIYAGVVQEEWTGGKAIKAPYDGLIPVELWNKANRGKQKIVHDKDGNIDIEYFDGEVQIDAPIIKRPKNYNPEYMFAKVLVCPECGGHLTAERARSKNGNYHYYYQCRGKKGVKHKNYSLVRDKANEEILQTFKDATFDTSLIELLGVIAGKVFKERIEEQKEKTFYIEKSISDLESKEKFILESTDKLISYPELLERKYEELKDVKSLIRKKRCELEKQTQTFGLDRFKNNSRKILEHPEVLALHKENPEVIQLGFEILFQGKIVYEEIKSRTPIKDEFLALANKKEFQLKGNSSVNRKWWDIRGSNPGPSP